MYPIDRRKIAIHVYSLLNSLRKTGILLQVSHTTIARWLKRVDRKKKAGKVNKCDIVVEVLRKSILNNPFISLSEMRDIVMKTLDINVSKELVRQVIKRQGFTKKKARFYGISKAQVEKTKVFLECRESFKNQGKQFVSIDEVSFGRSGCNIKGYSMKGTKLFVKKNIPRMTTTSVVACVSNDGLVGKKQLVGAFNTQHFLDFLKNLKLDRGTIILLDNVSFHHSKSIKEFATNHDLQLLYVPPYSPWFNPIEMCFSIIKRHFYQYQNIELAFKALTIEHCNSFFKKSMNLLEGPF